MNSTPRLNRRMTQLAVGQHLSYRAVRLRLTLLYGGLFLLSGAALMAIAYALLVNAGFVFTLQTGPATGPVTGQPANLARAAPPAGTPAPGPRTHPSTQTLAYWRTVARCVREHGVDGFPDPTTSVPSRSFANAGVVLTDHNGALFAIPSSVQQSPEFRSAAVTCGFVDRYQGELWAQENRQRTDVRQQLLIESGIALASMSVLSLGLGWLMAGRVLQPLEDSYQAQRQFVANASHELRAPLTRLRALSEVALASPQANLASLRRAHERVVASESDLERLIDGLLALTRGQAGLERHERRDLAALASQAILAHGSQLQDLGLDVRQTLEPAPTMGDPRLLERLITNLIDNAICHNAPGGHLEIATGTRDRHPFLSISNTGPTIPSDEIGRLFQPFERLGAARTGRNNGHGLGLSIVQAIANAHDAELSARPRPDGGLTINISFPSTMRARSRLRFINDRAKRGAPSPISEPDAPARG
jgi:signal transduction histidine kinase